MNPLKLLLAITCTFFLFVPTIQANDTRDNYSIAITGDDFVSRALFDAIGSKYNIQFNYQEYATFGDVLHSLTTGESDLAPNATFTQERSKIFSFSAPTNIEYTYLFSQQGTSLKSMRRVAVPVNTIFADLVHGQHPTLDTIEFSHADHAMQLINSGEVDGIVAPINYLTKLGETGLQAQLINDQVAATPVSIATMKGKHLQIVKSFINYIHSEAVQRLLHQTVVDYQRDIRKGYLRDRLQNSGLDTTQPITIKLETLFPYAFYAQNSEELTGISADVLKESCKVLQFNCRILSQPYESWNGIYSEFENLEFDLIGPIRESQARKSFIHFSAPHHDSTSVLVKRVGYNEGVYHYLSELITERIGVVHQGFALEKLSQSLPQKEFYYFEHQQALIDALVTNKVDYIALDRTTLNQLLRDKSHLYIEEDRHVGALYSSSIAFGFNKTDRGALLADYFTMAMDVIDTEAIIDKYDTQPAWRNLYNAEQNYSTRVIYISLSFASFAIIALAFLHYQSTTDQLTGLKNRRALERRFSSGVPLGVQVLYIDVNRFKKLNDQMGHAFGDYVLKYVANQIKHRWRGKAYRIGGDEFILVGRFDDQYVRNFVKGFRTISVKRIGYPSTTVSLSIGVSQGQYNGYDFQTVLKEADLAMYHDKADGSRQSK